MKMTKFLELFRKPKTASDPVCNMNVTVDNPKGGVFIYSGSNYYFCSTRCKSLFENDPGSFLSQSGIGGKSTHQHSEVDDSEWEFMVDVAENDPNIIYVEYMCPCGCEPGARYELESETSGWEHCCCGRVHFAGKNANTEIVDYLEERAKTSMDQDVGPYTFESTEVITPTGQLIPVSYAQPAQPRK